MSSEMSTVNTSGRRINDDINIDQSLVCPDGPPNFAITISDNKPKPDALEQEELKVKEEHKRDTTIKENGGCSSDLKNNTSTVSTAFTISFEDDDGNATAIKKSFSIRDSIRKFAPPKLKTVEKPRASRQDTSNHDNSYSSIESASGNYQKKSSSAITMTFRRGTNNSSRRSVGHQSDSSRNSNISESAAFLIDKMLNLNEQGEPLSSIYLDSGKKVRQSSVRVARDHSTTMTTDKVPSEDVLDDEIDYCEDRSDNGTYTVGTDPESDAARKRIDELFGVIKTAEASLKANAAITKQDPRQLPLATYGSRQSRAHDKRHTNHGLHREQHENTNRSSAGRHSSRSSSSSRQELTSSTGGHYQHRPRSANRQQVRNLSCDRGSRLATAQRHNRRAPSQSSNRDLSELDDVGSSRSSLHAHDTTDMLAQQENQLLNISSNPSMKFNRAFALRRARLGLGEPLRAGQLSMQSNGLSYESTNDGPMSLHASPKRTAAISSGKAHSRNSQATSQNLSRTDGGRFSLRMRNTVASRLTAGLRSSNNHNGIGITDNHIGRLSAGQNSVKTSALKSSANRTTPTYPSGDELDVALLSPSRSRQTCGRYTTVSAATSSTSEFMKPSNPSSRHDIVSEREMTNSDHGNYLHGLDKIETKLYTGISSRMCPSANAKRGNSASTTQHTQRSDRQQPLGALDCLVISAISSLSMKIRGSVCDLMVEHSKRLPSDNEIRLIVEEILPQLTASTSRPKSPISIEEIDQSMYFDLAQILKNMKKLEQMVDVMKMISSQIPVSSFCPSGNSLENNSNSNTASKSSSISLPGVLPTGSERDARPGKVDKSISTVGGEAPVYEGSNTNSEATSLSPV